MGAIAIAIVTYGVHTPQGRAFQTYAIAHPELFYEPFDVRRDLFRDPAENKKRFTVQHGQNSDFNQTQLALLDDSRFYACAARLVRGLTDDASVDGAVAKVVPLYCSAGNHRCDGIAKVAAKVLNTAVDEWQTRVYNVKVFSCANIGAQDVVGVVATDARAWLKKPFTLAEPGDWGEHARQAVCVRFSRVLFVLWLISYVVCCARVSSKTNLEQANERAFHQMRLFSALSGVLSDMYADQHMIDPITYMPYGDDVDADDYDDDKHTAASAPIPTPPRTPPPPAVRRSSSSATPWSAPRSRTPRRVETRSRTVPCAYCDGTGKKRLTDTIGAIANFSTDPSKWKDVLAARGCDDTAFIEFYALASSSDWGYTRAMRIIHNIMKKEAGGHPVQNVSAFIVSGTKDAWHN